MPERTSKRKRSLAKVVFFVQFDDLRPPLAKCEYQTAFQSNNSAHARKESLYDNARQERETLDALNIIMVRIGGFTHGLLVCVDSLVFARVLASLIAHIIQHLAS